MEQSLIETDVIHGSLRWKLCIPRESPSNNVLRGLHFQAYKKMRNMWRLEVMAALKGQRPDMPIQRSFLKITRSCVGGGLDWDNVYGGLKPVLDCLVARTDKNPDGLGLIQDDSPKHMPFRPDVRQTSAKRGGGSTVIEVYELAKI